MKLMEIMVLTKDQGEKPAVINPALITHAVDVPVPSPLQVPIPSMGTGVCFGNVLLITREPRDEFTTRWILALEGRDPIVLEEAEPLGDATILKMGDPDVRRRQ